MTCASCTFEELLGARDLADLARSFFAVDRAKSLDIIGMKLAFGGFSGGSGSVHGCGFVFTMIEAKSVSGFVGDGVLEVDGGDGSGDTRDAGSIETEAIIAVIDLDIKAKDLPGAAAVDNAGDGDGLAVVCPITLSKEDDILIFGGFVLVISSFREVGQTDKLGLKAATSGIHPRLKAGFDRVVSPFDVGYIGATRLVDEVLDGEFVPEEGHFFAIGGGGFGANEGLGKNRESAESDAKRNKSQETKRESHEQRPSIRKGGVHCVERRKAEGGACWKCIGRPQTSLT